ncbi:hypothetical protein [Acaryochloris marina]|uniref:Uncharacterized protein n=1 Tax=Acaryochloris marina (strain MBIC 11017) TaxID=329726 RepID=A8ZLN2_ACAM1|nr:hypothetical protein [Acaryochloris marina]ABW32059.1 conserved hypothetical protein [Acaryochloris marina MBIC11017]BDM83130.1 hypothetical protein AM10699_59910 [Acaryochloris marina MBIC10699]
MFKQLELDFASALASALDEPEQADISLMCASLDQHLQGRSSHEQLRVAGDAIRDIADVVCQRAELLIQDWEDRHNTQGPVLDDDFLAGLVQETMFLDVSDLCRQPKSRKQRHGFTGKPVESVVGEVSKDDVLEFVDELESGEAVALKVSHEEDVGAWVGAIHDFLEGKEDAVLFGDLARGLGFAPVAVLIGVLLGGFRVEQRGGFYSQSLRVSQR